MKETSNPATLALQWASSQVTPNHGGGPEGDIFEADDRLTPIHPIYVIPFAAAENIHDWFANKARF